MRWSRHPGRALEAYLDDELDDRETLRVAEHLRRCPLCRQRVALTHRIRRVLRAMADPT